MPLSLSPLVISLQTYCYLLKGSRSIGRSEKTDVLHFIDYGYPRILLRNITSYENLNKIATIRSMYRAYFQTPWRSAQFYQEKISESLSCSLRRRGSCTSINYRRVRSSDPQMLTLLAQVGLETDKVLATVFDQLVHRKRNVVPCNPFASNSSVPPGSKVARKQDKSAGFGVRE